LRPVFMPEVYSTRTRQASDDGGGNLSRPSGRKSAQANLAAPVGDSSTAVDGWVTDVLALDDVNDVFGDVGGVVADAFEIFGNQN
jgi:hypothetical protein